VVVVGPLPCLWRAPTDNDEYGGYAERWRRAGLDADSTARVVEAVTLSLTLTLTLTLTLALTLTLTLTRTRTLALALTLTKT